MGEKQSRPVKGTRVWAEAIQLVATSVGRPDDILAVEAVIGIIKSRLRDEKRWLEEGSKFSGPECPEMTRLEEKHVEKRLGNLRPEQQETSLFDDDSSKDNDDEPPESEANKTLETVLSNSDFRHYEEKMTMEVFLAKFGKDPAYTEKIIKITMKYLAKNPLSEENFSSKVMDLDLSALQNQYF